MCSGYLSAQNIPLYIGTYTNSESKGIYYYNFNTETGKLTNKKLVAEGQNLSFLTISSDRKNLYAVGETNTFDTNKSGVVNAYSVNKNGSLKLLNKVSSNGAHPCHISINSNNTKIAVSNYTGGTTAIYNIEKNGSLNKAFQVINHNTPGIKSHAHASKFLNNELFIADLGRDFLAQYIENNNKFVLKENYMMTPKAGPRHFDISKNSAFIYVINELNSTVTVLQKGADKYHEIQTISTLSKDFIEFNACADIHLSANEQFLYGSNRGENTIVVFKRSIEDGTLNKIQSISVEGDWPRNFTLAPKGNFLLVANQKSNNISVYKVNKQTGILKYLYSEATAIPVCLLF